MAAAQTIPVADNGVGALLGSLLQNGGSLFGSGTTTSTDKSTPDPGTLANSNALLSSIQSSTSDSSLDDLVNGILDKAKVAFGPSIANSIAAGNRTYSDTTLADLQSRAQAYATQQAAGAKLSYIQQANNTSANLIDSQLKASTTSTKTSSTTASPTGNLVKAAGLAATGYSLYQKLKGNKNAASTVAGAATGNTSVGADSLDFGTEGGPGASAFGSPIDLSNSSATASDLFSNIDTAGGGQDFSSIFSPDVGLLSGNVGSDVSDLSSISTPLTDLSDTSTTGDITDLGSSLDTGSSLSEGLGDTSFGDAGGAGESFADAGSAVDEGLNISAPSALGDVGGAINIAGDIAAGDTTQEAGDFLGGSVIGDVAGAVSVICTEAVRQGLMNQKLYQEEALFNRKRVSQVTINGYHYLAMPLVYKMRENKKFAKICADCAIDYANYTLGAKRTVRGFILSYLGEKLCYLVGTLVGPQPFYNLYNKEV